MRVSVLISFAVLGCVSLRLRVCAGVAPPCICASALSGQQCHVFMRMCARRRSVDTATNSAMCLVCVRVSAAWVPRRTAIWRATIRMRATAVPARSAPSETRGCCRHFVAPPAVQLRAAAASRKSSRIRSILGQLTACHRPLPVSSCPTFARLLCTAPHIHT